MACRFDPCYPHHVVASDTKLATAFLLFEVLIGCARKLLTHRIVKRPYLSF